MDCPLRPRQRIGEDGPPRHASPRIICCRRCCCHRATASSKGKEICDKTYISDRHDVDVVLGVLGVRNEGLDEELAQDTSDGLDLLLLTSTLGDPGASLGPGLVEGQETALATALDQLIGLGDELDTGLENPGVGDLGLVEDILDVGILGEVQRAQPGGRVVLGGDGKRRGLDDGSAGEVVVEDGLAVGLEDGLGGHSGGCEVRKR